MSLEENKAIVRRTIEAINKQNLSLCDDLAAPDFVDHTRQVRGLEVLKQFVTMIYKSFSNFHVTIEDMISEEDKVWIRVKYGDTHRWVSWTSLNWQEVYRSIHLDLSHS